MLLCRKANCGSACRCGPSPSRLPDSRSLMYLHSTRQRVLCQKFHFAVPEMDFPSFTESTDFYGIVLYSLIIAAVVARFLLKPARVFTARLLKSRKYTLFCSDWRVVRFLRKNDLIRHWTIQQALIFCAYFSANLVCVFVRYPGLLEAGIRSGRLALINLIILYAGPHLGFLADAANVTMSTYHHVHSAVSFTVFALAVFHSVTASLHKQNDTFASPQLLFGLTVSICIANRTILTIHLRLYSLCAFRLASFPFYVFFYGMR